MQIMCNSSSAFHLQPIVCCEVRRDSSAVKFDRDEIAFILALFYWLKPLTVEGGEETGVPMKTSDEELLCMLAMIASVCGFSWAS